MLSIFDGVISQYIDDSGKARILNYKGVSLAISPIPPMDVPEVSIDDTMVITLSRALEFVEKYSLEVTEKCGYEVRNDLKRSNDLRGSKDKKLRGKPSKEEEIITGLWLKVGDSVSFGFLFIDAIDGESDTNALKALKNIPYNNEVPDPILVGVSSAADIARQNYKIAEYLKQYSIVEYAHAPSTFGEKNYSIRENHEYNLPAEGLGTRLTRRNAYFYTGGKLIVPDADTRDRLIYYAKVSAYNDRSIINRYKAKLVIDGPVFYKSIKDFTPRAKQLLFTSREDITRWKTEASNIIADYSVSNVPLPYNVLPYYYRNMKIEGGRLMIIQNTEAGDFPSALACSKKWETQHINVGYNPVDIVIPEEEDLYFEVFTDEGRTHTSGDNGGPLLKIFAYTQEEGGYAALLFL